MALRPPWKTAPNRKHYLSTDLLCSRNLIVKLFKVIDVVDRLNTESAKAMLAADTQERFATIGAETRSGTPEQAAEFLRSEYARWGKLIREAGIKPE